MRYTIQIHTNPATDGYPELQALYNRIMADIEPELMYENIAGLDEKYAQQSPEQKKQRVEHYAASMERCFALMDLVLSLQTDDMTRFRTHVMHRLKQQADAEDTHTMTALEQSLNDA